MMTSIVRRLIVVNPMAGVDLCMNVNAQKIAFQTKIALKVNAVQVTAIVGRDQNIAMTLPRQQQQLQQ